MVAIHEEEHVVVSLHQEERRLSPGGRQSIDIGGRVASRASDDRPSSLPSRRTVQTALHLVHRRLACFRILVEGHPPFHLGTTGAHRDCQFASDALARASPFEYPED